MPKIIVSPAKCEVRAVIRFLYLEKVTKNVVLRYCPSSWIELQKVRSSLMQETNLSIVLLAVTYIYTPLVYIQDKSKVPLGFCESVDL